MNDLDLDTAYTRLCQAMTTLGEPRARLFLARFALLAMTEMADAEQALRLIDAAEANLSGGA